MAILIEKEQKKYKAIKYIKGKNIIEVFKFCIDNEIEMSYHSEGIYCLTASKGVENNEWIMKNIYNGWVSVEEDDDVKKNYSIFENEIND